MVAEAIFAVEPAGGGEFAEERTGGAGENRNIGAADFGGVEGVTYGLRERDVAGDDGDGGDANFARAEGHDESDSVVGGGVGVDEESARHGGGALYVVRQLAELGCDGGTEALNGIV